MISKADIFIGGDFNIDYSKVGGSCNPRKFWQFIHELLPKNQISKLIRLWDCANRLRNRCNISFRLARRKYITDSLNDHAENPRKFWQFIHELLPKN